MGNMSARQGHEERAAAQAAVLRESSPTRPRVWMLTVDGERLVVKDFGPNRWFFRQVVGRFLVWREKRALLRLRGIRGIPRFHGTLKGPALVMEAFEGRSLERPEEIGPLPAGFFEAAEALLRAIHARGTAHCDLKRATNFLLGPDGLPYIIDWGASIGDREFRGYPLRLILARFQQDDDNALTKLKLKYAPETVPAAEKARYLYRSLPERLIRRMRDRARAILQRVA